MSSAVVNRSREIKMMKVRKLAVVFTVASTMTALSAFAESRHRDATREQSHIRRENRSDSRSDNRSYDRGSRNDRGYDNDRSGYRNHNYRNDNYRNDNYRNDSRRDYSTHGRVTRMERYRGGYRVWVGGGYPFYVPEARWRLYPLRVGVSIRLGGYWNAGGYYDVYDYGPYDGAYGGGYRTSGDVRGIVEEVDYRRGTAVVRDDDSGDFITVVLRGRDSRLGSLRRGDYVTLGGDWTRGVFYAYNVLDQRYDDRYDRRNDRRY
jgi:hypothetical protein